MILGAPKKSDTSTKEQLERALKEIKQLRTQNEALSRENSLLKQSVYDLSVEYSYSKERGGAWGNEGKVVFKASGESGSREGLFRLAGTISSSGQGPVTELEFSPSGAHFAVLFGSDSLVRIISGTDFGVTSEISGELQLCNVAWLSNELLIVSTKNGLCKLFDLSQNPSNAVTLFGFDGIPLCLTSDLQNLVAVSTSRNHCHVYDKRHAKTIRIDCDASVTACKFVDSSLILLGDAKGNVRTFDVRTGKLLKKKFCANFAAAVNVLDCCKLLLIQTQSASLCRRWTTVREGLVSDSGAIVL